MTPAPPPVEKLLAVLKGFTAEERRQVGAWLAAGEFDRALLRAAFAVETAAGVLSAVRVDRAPHVPDPPPPRARPDGRARRGTSPLRLAAAMARLGRPAEVLELAAACNRGTAWVYPLLAHPYFACVRGHSRPAVGPQVPGLYDLSPAGRAAVAAEPAGVCAEGGRR